MSEINLILGAGEIGTSIGKVLDSGGSTVFYLDPDKGFIIDLNNKDFISTVIAVHICFPYTSIDQFISGIKSIRKLWGSTIIIHSTVAMGTTDKLIEHIEKQTSNPVSLVYSPVRGRHPNLINDIYKFVKYYVGTSNKAESNFCNLFRHIPLDRFPDFKSLEFAKIADTTYYGMCLSYMRCVKSVCDKFNLDFNMVYNEYGHTYNDRVDRNFRRPIYKFIPGPIGGHCVIPNLDLLPDDMRPIIEVVLFGDKLFDRVEMS